MVALVPGEERSMTAARMGPWVAVYTTLLGAPERTNVWHVPQGVRSP